MSAANDLFSVRGKVVMVTGESSLSRWLILSDMLPLRELVERALADSSIAREGRCAAASLTTTPHDYNRRRKGNWQDDQYGLRSSWCQGGS